MTIVELIGFLIALAVLLFSALRRVLDERRRRADPEGYEREQRKKQEEAEKAYRELMKSLNIEVPEEKAPPPPVPTAPKQRKKATQKAASRRLATAHREPHRKLSDQFEFHAKLDDRKQVSEIETRKVGTRIKNRFGKGYGQMLVDPELQGEGPAVSKTRGRPPRIRNLVQGLPSHASLIYAKEIIGPPKALQRGWGDIPADIL